MKKSCKFSSIFSILLAAATLFPINAYAAEITPESCDNPSQNTVVARSAAAVPLNITKDPEDVAGREGDDIKFTVQAQGEGLKYQWQFSKDGVNWTDGKMTGWNTSVLPLNVISGRYAYLWRCKVTDKYGNTAESASARILPIPLRITQQPENIIIPENEEVTFTVKAQGYNLSYQWQHSKDGVDWRNSRMTGWNTDALPLVSIPGRYAYKWRCIIKDGFGNEVVSNEAMMRLPQELSVKDIDDVNAKLNEEVAFTVYAEGDGLTYQWQHSKDGVDWRDSRMTGWNTDTLPLAAIEGRFAYKWRCKVTDMYGNSHITNAARLIIATPQTIEMQPKDTYEGTFNITKDPEDVAAREGEDIEFTVKAQGEGLKYQWQFSKDGVNWTNGKMTGWNKSVLPLNVISGRYAYLWRCEVTDKYGNTVESAPARILPVPLRITQQPENIIIPENEELTFTVKAQGYNLKYQWQHSKDGVDWRNSRMTGWNTDSLPLVSIPGRYAYKWRCIIKDGFGNEVVSDEAVMRRPQEFYVRCEIDDVYAEVDEEVAFFVYAEGDGLKYQWQHSKDGVDWRDSRMTGWNTNTLPLVAIEGRFAYKWRCKVTDMYGNYDITADARLIRVTPLTIRTQPKDAYAAADESISFNIIARGTGLTYQWQSSKDGVNWTNTKLNGYNTPTLSMTATSGRFAYQWRCIVKDVRGNTVVSEPAKIAPHVELKILEQPQDVFTSEDNIDVTFTVKAQGNALTYTWETAPYGYQANVWKGTHYPGITGFNTDTLTVRTTGNNWNYYWHCVIRDGEGNTVTTVPVHFRTPIELRFLSQPEDIYTLAGKTVTFMIDAEGEGITYQWQRSTDGGKTWRNTTLNGNDTSCLFVYVTDELFSWQWRCVVSDASGSTITSNVVKLIRRE